MLGAAALVLIAMPNGSSGTARAEEIVVANYGVTANGFPFAVAMGMGFFKAEGADVTGIITSAGGGTTLRNMMAGGVAYAEVNPGLVVSAIHQGAELKIIAENVRTNAETTWGVKPNSPLMTVKDLKGRKLGYSNPRSTSQALVSLLLKHAGYTPNDAELVRTGGFGEGIAALEIGAVDMTPFPEPLWAIHKHKYRALATVNEVLPPLTNTIAATIISQGKTKAEFIKAVIRSRRKAVEFMNSNPDEAAEPIAKAFNIELAVARSAVRNLVENKTGGVPYWGSGQIHMDSLHRMIEVQKSLGTVTKDVDYDQIIDTSFLAADIQAIVK